MALQLWTDCPRQGRVLRGFVPHKVPLDDATSDALGIEEGDRFTTTMLVERQILAKAPIGLAISLLMQPPRAPAASGAAGSSDPWAAAMTEWEDWDIEFANVPCAAPLAIGTEGLSGFSEQLPPTQLVTQFIERCAAFWAISSDGGAAPNSNAQRCIAVHCNTGYNVSGYLICHFLIAANHVPVQTALAAFAEARPPGIYNRAFIEALFRFHRQAMPAVGSHHGASFFPPEQWPAWHSRLHEAEAAATPTAALPPGARAGQPAALTAGARAALGSEAAAPAAATAHAGHAPGSSAAASAPRGPPRPPVPLFAPQAASSEGAPNGMRPPAPPAGGCASRSGEAPGGGGASGGGGAGAADAAGCASAGSGDGGSGARPSACAEPPPPGSKRARTGEAASAPAAALQPLPRLLHPPPGSAGWSSARPFGSAVLGGTRARARRICCQLLGLPPPADTLPPAAAGGGAPASGVWSPLGFAWATPLPLSRAVLHAELAPRGEQPAARGPPGAAAGGAQPDGADEFFAALEPLVASPDVGGAAATGGAAGAGGAGAGGAAAPLGLPVCVLWLEGKAYGCLEQPVTEQGAPAAQAAPPAERAGPLPPGQGADVWLLVGLQLPGLPDRSLLVGALAPPSAAGGARRWRLCVRECVALGGRSVAAEPLERRLALLGRHALQPRKALAAEQVGAEPVSLVTTDFFRPSRTQYLLEQLRPALSAQFEVGLLTFRRRSAPYPLDTAAHPAKPTTAAAGAPAKAFAYGWYAGSRPVAPPPGEAAAADAQLPPTEAELRACEWLRQ